MCTTFVLKKAYILFIITAPNRMTELKQERLATKRVAHKGERKEEVSHAHFIVRQSGKTKVFVEVVARMYYTRIHRWRS